MSVYVILLVINLRNNIPTLVQEFVEGFKMVNYSFKKKRHLIPKSADKLKKYNNVF